MLEQIYNDFTTKLLPQIQEGLVITKDYFTDLFGRYVHYLIVKDSLVVLANLILFIISIVLLRVAYKVFKDDSSEMFIFPLMCGAIALMLSVGMLSVYLDNLIKDIYIPEVRVYQEFKNYNH